MNTLWWAGSVIAVVLGLAYVVLPKRIHAFGFEFLRRSSSDRSEESDTPVWLYRGLGVLFLCIGVTGLV
ncbi:MULTISPECIES: hypothetical protein [Halorubrum]|uniref:DUF6199 domain-containing protein n=2 Tax=Halorubrum TaxID=56688 RepID=M0FKM5_9EURY|nr:MULTISPECIES: hypothetical protein [Halorubrum]ELZ38956.1 hypothetical protein C472_05426 [Halorubrum tebenquichense DSM 14210]ELZ60566.1 hypothetical protein C467_02138 [Halorubrum hochstenium ATCC 700873]